MTTNIDEDSQQLANPQRVADPLFERVYGDLRRLAQDRIVAEPGGATLTATGLVHQAYLKLAKGGGWANRSHFVAVAVGAMRQILIDRARARNAQKRGGGARPETLPTGLPAEEEADARVLAVAEALDRLAVRDPDLARLVELRFFGGLDTVEVADVLGVSPRTAGRWWARAKAHLLADLSEG